MPRKFRSNLVLTWLVASCLLMPIGGAIWFGLAGKIGFSLAGPAYYVGALIMGGWTVCIALPHLIMMVYWAKSIGVSETSRIKLLGGMLVFALPQATLFAMILGLRGFWMAYVTGTLALWLPRALLPSLRPGAFAG